MVLLALSNDSKLVLATLFCVAMAVVVGLLWIVQRQGTTRPRRDARPPTPGSTAASPPALSGGGGNVPETVAAILRADPTAKIEAIKAYRLATGLGLKESKDAVDAWLEGHPAFPQASTAAPPVAAGFPPQVAAILRERPNDKISAIKVYRETTGLGLKESKDAVEAWLAGARDS